MRIDDPWQAEYWRRTNAYRTSGSGSSVRWMSDAVSVYEVTAALIFDRILDPRRKHPFDRLVIIGNSPLALAACIGSRSGAGGRCAVGSTPSRSCRFDLVRARGGSASPAAPATAGALWNSGDIGLISVVESEPTSERLRAALQRAQYPALILADDPTTSEPRLATYLAALNPAWTIFDWALPHEELRMNRSWTCSTRSA